MSIYDQLSRLGIVLPPVSVPAAAYVPFVQTGHLIFLSGHIAKQGGKPWVGQLGLTMTTDEGKAAARAVAVDLLGTLAAACLAAGKDLNHVKRIVKVLSLVNSTPTTPSSTWSPTAAANSSARSSARWVRTRAAPSAWRSCPWARVWRSS
jgi:enamine deaminase RidA (YjgF/YER057c/UK114 family)